MSQHTSAPDIMRLHVRDRLAADGTPAMTERFLSRLDRCLAASRGTREDAAAAQPLTLTEGLARLQAERPVWWECVELCCRQGLTERATATAVGVSQALVHRRKVAGLTHVAAWCALDVDDVADRLTALATRHGYVLELCVIKR